MIFKNLKLKIRNWQAGMTYIELIVVLSIFAVMSTVVMYNYGDFQSKVDIKNLASDIALKIVEAQKSSLSGKLPLNPPDNWKPSYGVYFDTSSEEGKKSLIYFANIGAGDFYGDSDVILDKPEIKRNYYISDLKCDGASIESGILSIVFRRPDSRALMPCSNAQIFISSPGSEPSTASISISAPGRIQID